MNNSAAELIDPDESDRPTLVPPAPASLRPADTSDVDATWPDESPRHSFIAERGAAPESADAAPRPAETPRPPVKVHRNSVAAAPPTDESSIIRVASEPEPALAPPMDTYEDERALLVFIDLPGVAPEALVVELSNVALHVRGTMAEDPRRQLPISPGRREIVIGVPRGTEAEAVDASLRNGLLRIRVDKTGATTRHVEIAHTDA